MHARSGCRSRARERSAAEGPGGSLENIRGKGMARPMRRYVESVIRLWLKVKDRCELCVASGSDNHLSA
jgi:hypothetical protein